MYRVQFRFAYGGTYYSGSFTDYNDVECLVADILNSEDHVRLLGVEISDDTGKTWEPWLRDEGR